MMSSVGFLDPTETVGQVKRKTMIVRVASQRIGASVTKPFIERGYSVVANSIDIDIIKAPSPSVSCSLRRARRATPIRDGSPDRGE
jgi:hypothetical protein